MFNETLIHRYDAMCHTLLSNRLLFSWILHDYIPEYTNCSLKDISQLIDGPVRSLRIRGIQTTDKIPLQGEVTFDNLYKVYLPDRQDYLLINIEGQNRFHQSYPLVTRALYYAARVFVGEKGVDFVAQDYGELKKVYSIWIMFAPPKQLENSVSRFEMNELFICKHNEHRKVDYGKIEVLMMYLGNHEEVTGPDALHFLDVLFSSQLPLEVQKTILEQTYQFDYDKYMEVIQMQRSIGREWIEFERYEAKQEGKREERTLIIRNFILNFLKQGQDISSIVANMVSTFHITKEEAEKYIQDVSEELI